MMNLAECYRIVGLPQSASDEDIKKSFKLLAHKYHPDKNPNRVEWANEAMANLNEAYTFLMTHRFKEEKNVNYKGSDKSTKQARASKAKKEDNLHDLHDFKEEIEQEILTKEFVKIREKAKDDLYKYFQFGIYNIARREKIQNRSVFNTIVLNIKKSYHAVNNLKRHTRDIDFIKHFDTFSSMLYNFYIASECVNIIDSYSNAIEVEAYRSFKRGDDTLHPSEKEIFYDRHNRGYFKKSPAVELLSKSELFFKNTLLAYPKSTWAIETKIKLGYALSLKEYIKLFFSENN